MIYLLYGQDEVTLGETLSSMKDDIRPAELRDVNITVLDGADVNFDQLAAICATVPFMADRRMVIVEGLLARFEPRLPSRAGPRSASAQGRALGEWDGLPDLSSSMPPTTDLLFVEGRLSASNPLFAKLRPVAKALSFPLPSGNELRQWIRRRAARQGADIEPRAVNTLAETIGGNLRVIDLELQKLALYRLGQQIRHEDVQELVAYVREANIFAAVDAVVEGRPSVAIRLVHRILDSGRSPAYVITMIARQVRFLLLAKDLGAQGVPRARMGERLSLTGYPLRKTLEQERRFTAQRLAEIHHKLLEADVSIKTGEVGEQLALDLLIAELSAFSSRYR